MNQAPRIKSFPDLVRMEVVAAALSLLAACMLSVLWDAPVQGPADPEAVPAVNVKAPWIFVGIQELLRYMPPFIAGIAIPASVVIFLSALPYIGTIRGKPRRGMCLLFFGVIAACVALTIVGLYS
ncbi:MAG: hypothetical protein V2B18_25475 [Pseudomonadota bacterium]